MFNQTKVILLTLSEFYHKFNLEIEASGSMSMKRTASIAATLFLVVWVAVSVSSHAEGAPVLLVDQSHDQRFVVEKEEPLHLSGFAAVMREEGFSVAAGSEPLSDESLAGIDALVISGPFKAIAPREVDAVVRFLARGGRLAVMLHIASPFADLFRPLEVDFTNFVLGEQENIIDGDPKNFQVKSLADHPMFKGMQHIRLYGGWALLNTADSAQIIALTSPRGWVDFNGDGKLSKGDVEQPFGVVVAGNLGSGRFVVFGDDAIFQNKFLDDGNRKLAANLARWLKP